MENKELVEKINKFEEEYVYIIEKMEKLSHYKHMSLDDFKEFFSYLNKFNSMKFKLNNILQNITKQDLRAIDRHPEWGDYMLSQIDICQKRYPITLSIYLNL